MARAESGGSENVTADMRVMGVRVTAEWALYGKTGSDTGNRLLHCSNGRIAPENFGNAVTRYSIGTGVSVPQITASWLSDKNQYSELSFVAIGVHDKPEHEQYDAVGREIVQTSYFCVPYNELAAGAVSYLTMYEAFRKFPLPRQDCLPITTDLPLRAAPVPAGSQPAQVAALLLTNKPVCILGADGVGFIERLRFIDAVVSLLPYGMRSQLSASTWVSSTFREHKFRLFFTNAPRSASDDQIVDWNGAGNQPTGHELADEYLYWLRNETRRPVGWLAGEHDKRGFTQPDVLKILERVRGSSLRPLPAQPISRELPKPAQPGVIQPRLTRGTTVHGLLVASDGWLAAGESRSLKSVIQELRSHLSDPDLVAKRTEYRQLVAAHRLLRRDVQVDGRLMTEFYVVLLQLVFGTPLSYLDYCNVEASAGRDGPLPQPLLQAMYDAGLKSARARLLAAAGHSRRRLKAEFRSLAEDPENLLQTVLCRDLQSHHAGIICDILVHELNERAGIFDLRERFGRVNRDRLRQALHKHYYLAPMLKAHFTNDPDYQLAVLTGLLRAVYGLKLDRPAITSILVNSLFEPTTALQAAVMKLAPNDTAFVAVEFSRGCLDNAGFNTVTRDELRFLVSGADQIATQEYERRDSGLGPG